MKLGFATSGSLCIGIEQSKKSKGLSISSRENKRVKGAFNAGTREREKEPRDTLLDSA
jgi:hypothetical protein